MDEPTALPEAAGAPESDPWIPGDHERLRPLCDRCGALMFEDRCKIICPNCGHRFDCSDLNLYFD
jgi:hypothetical protein